MTDDAGQKKRYKITLLETKKKEQKQKKGQRQTGTQKEVAGNASKRKKGGTESRDECMET